jgi:hypothetical protein
LHKPTRIKQKFCLLIVVFHPACYWIGIRGKSLTSGFNISSIILRMQNVKVQGRQFLPGVLNSRSKMLLISVLSKKKNFLENIK